MVEIILVCLLTTCHLEWRTVGELESAFWRTTRFLYRAFTFTLYSSKFFEVIKPHLPEAHAYAEDSQLYLSLKPNNEVNESELCIRAIRTWMWMDKLKLNDDKTEFMIIGSRQQLEKVSVAELSVGDISIVPASTAGNLAVLFDPDLSLMLKLQKHVQVTSICTI